MDEAITARVIKEYDFWQIPIKFSPYDFHPPLYYLFMKLWSNFLGYSELALRLPSIIFSLLTGYLIYKITKELFGKITGLWATSFFLFNPLLVYYSQEARMYMLAVFLLTTSLYFFLKLISNITYEKSVRSASHFKAGRSKLNIKNQIFFNLFIFLSLLTFYGSIFLIMTFLLYFLYKKQYKNLLICLFVIFVNLLVIYPLLYQQFINAKDSLRFVANWSLILGNASVKNLLLIPLKFSIGRISFYPKWLYWLIAGVWTFFVFSQLVKNFLAIKNRQLAFLFLQLLIFPLILGFFISFFTPLLQYFRFLYLLPIISILLSYSLKPSLFNLGKILILSGFLILSLVYLFVPPFHREDWKGLAKILPKDKTVFMIDSSSDPLKYYQPAIKIESLTKISDQSINLSEIFVIPYTAEIYGINYRQILQDNKFYLDQTTNFRGLTIEKWKKKRTRF